MTATPSLRDARPVPPRSWWLKRILLVGAALLVALGALRWWWGREAQRRLDTKIAEYRAAGQPVLLEDFVPPPIPDAENAAVPLQRAHSFLVTPTDTALADILASHAYCRQHADAVGRFVGNNAKTLKAAREARDRPRADWGTRFRSPAIATMLPNLAPQRALGKLLCAAAIDSHHRGDDAKAFEYVRDALHCAALIDEPPNTMINHSVRIALEILAAKTVEHTAPHLRISGLGGAVKTTGGSVTAGQVRTLIAQLLDERALRDGWRRAMYAERAIQLDSVSMLTQGRVTYTGVVGPVVPPGPDRAFRALLGPAWKLDTVRLLEYSTVCAEAAADLNWPAAEARLPPFPKLDTARRRVVRAMSYALMPALDRLLGNHFILLSYRRLATVALAIRLFELENGRRPAKLDELVPEYLPLVPRDPFAGHNRAIGYRPDDSPPVLYSIGFDGVDDQGAHAVRKGGGINLWLKDIPFFLNGDRPPPQPVPRSAQPTSTQTVDDDGDVEDGGGDNEQEEQRTRK